MAFDKEHYNKRRMAGLSGTASPGRNGRGIVQVDNFGRYKQATVGNKPVSKKALRKNTKRARKAQAKNVTE